MKRTQNRLLILWIKVPNIFWGLEFKEPSWDLHESWKEWEQWLYYSKSCYNQQNIRFCVGAVYFLGIQTENKKTERELLKRNYLSESSQFSSRGEEAETPLAAKMLHFFTNSQHSRFGKSWKTNMLKRRDVVIEVLVSAMSCNTHHAVF